MPPPPPPVSFAFDPEAPRPVGPPKTSGAAVASVVLGAFSLCCLCFTALPAIICGLMGLANIGKSNGQLKGRGLAILGIILSLVLTIAGLAGYVVFGGKKLAEIPELREIFGAFPTMTQASTNAVGLAEALKAHAEANEGKLPDTLDELVTGGTLEASKLLHPGDSTPDFWKLAQPGGTILKDLPAKTVVVRGGPIEVADKSLEILIFADGTVKPQEAAPAVPSPLPGEADHGANAAPAPAEEGSPEQAPVAPEPVETPAAPGP